jgi:DNA-binding GntR family transcriptional regulator
VLEHLRAAITDGRIRPGERLRVQEWALRLNVSSSPIREALATLETEGFIRVIPHKGATVVTGASYEDIEDGYKVFGHLEGVAAEFATSRPGEKERALLCRRMRAANRQFEAAIERHQLERAEQFNRQFHDLFFNAAGSPALDRAHQLNLTNVPGASRLIWELLAESAADIAAFTREHEAIVCAIEQGDPAIASAAALEHADRTIERVRASVRARRMSDAGEIAE